MLERSWMLGYCWLGQKAMLVRMDRAEWKSHRHVTRDIGHPVSVTLQTSQLFACFECLHHGRVPGQYRQRRLCRE